MVAVWNTARMSAAVVVKNPEVASFDAPVAAAPPEPKWSRLLRLVTAKPGNLRVRVGRALTRALRPGASLHRPRLFPTTINSAITNLNTEIVCHTGIRSLSRLEIIHVPGRRDHIENVGCRRFATLHTPSSISDVLYHTRRCLWKVASKIEVRATSSCVREALCPTMRLPSTMSDRSSERWSPPVSRSESLTLPKF